MRHGRTINHLGRSSSNRRSMMLNLAISLIKNKKLNTTLAKGKALRKYIEPLITKSKTDSTHSRRTVFSYLGDKEAVGELFRDIAQKVAERPGGYTRIFKTGNRLGDNAEMCLIELVDYNENYREKKEKADKKAKTVRRGRGTKKAKESVETTEITETTEEVDTPVDEVKEKKPKVKKIATEEHKEETKEEPKDEAPAQE